MGLFKCAVFTRRTLRNLPSNFHRQLLISLSTPKRGLREIGEVQQLECLPRAMLRHRGFSEKGYTDVYRSQDSGAHRIGG